MFLIVGIDCVYSRVCKSHMAQASPTACLILQTRHPGFLALKFRIPLPIIEYVHKTCHSQHLDTASKEELQNALVLSNGSLRILNVEDLRSFFKNQLPQFNTHLVNE